MRIAVVHSFYASDQPSGENAAVHAEVEALGRAGHDVHLVSASTDDLRRRPWYPVEAAVTVATGVGRSPLRHLERLAPDVVHVHNLFPNFGHTWLRRLEVPFVHTLHNYRALCAAGTLYRPSTPGGAGEACTLCVGGRTLPALRYRCYRNSSIATLPLALATRKGPRQPPLRAAKRIIVLSPRMRAIYERSGLDSSRLAEIPNFLPDSLDRGPGPGGASWLYVGRLSQEKAVGPLVAAWPADVPLKVIGAGPVARTVGMLAEGKRVELLDVRDRSLVLEEMRHAAGLLLPSQWPEGFPLVYAEALSAGLPVLAWRHNGVSDLVRRDGSGRVVNDFAGHLSEQLRAAAHDFPLMRAQCRDVFEARYGEQAHVQALTNAYADDPPRLARMGAGPPQDL